jgi:uncharacterized protein involved in tolerance to divalent cations
MTGEFVVVFITAPDTAEAERIAGALVEERLAACVNVLPGCRSIYRWDGALQSDDEALMIVKSARSLFPALEKRVGELHSYDVPEVIAFSLTAISSSYRAFLEDSISD